MIGFVRDNDVTGERNGCPASEAPHFLCCLNAGRYSKPNVPFELDYKNYDRRNLHRAIQCVEWLSALRPNW